MIKQILYLINVLVAAFEKTIRWIVGVKDSLYLVRGGKMLMRLVLAILDYANRTLHVGKRYFERVGNTLRYRTYFDTVTRPMKAHYRSLRKK